MAEYRLSPEAEQDLLGIARYTRETWGEEQLDLYEAALNLCFEALGEGIAPETTPLPDWPAVRQTRCVHHVVFSLHREGEVPKVLAILHEKMDLVRRLDERLLQSR